VRTEIVAVVDRWLAGALDERAAARGGAPPMSARSRRDAVPVAARLLRFADIRGQTRRDRVFASRLGAPPGWPTHCSSRDRQASASWRRRAR